MIKEVFVNKCKCESCDSIVEKFDTFCSVCGNDLTKEIKYVELKNTNKREIWK